MQERTLRRSVALNAKRMWALKNGRSWKTIQSAQASIVEDAEEVSRLGANKMKLVHRW